MRARKAENIPTKLPSPPADASPEYRPESIALAARASVVMDRRGTHRAAEFTIKGSTGGAIQLSGGVEIVMSRDHMLLRRAAAGAPMRSPQLDTLA